MKRVSNPAPLGAKPPPPPGPPYPWRLIADLSPEEVNRLEWRVCAEVIREAKQRLEAADGGRHTWMDAALGIAEDRARGL